jgi:hypothetical protein
MPQVDELCNFLLISFGELLATIAAARELTEKENHQLI